jgi:hypothetical protein
MKLLPATKHPSPHTRGFLALLAALTCFSATAFAQCGKDTVLTCSKTEYLNASGELQRTVVEECVIKFDKTAISIAPADKEVMTATVASTTCDWKVPFKTGRTIVQVKFKDSDGIDRDATITVEGKDGKITCQMTQKDRPDRVIKVTVDTFEDQKPAAGK